jgi:DNA-binding NarL/FixJ family response regulator
MHENPAVIRVLLALRLPISAELYAQALDRTAGIQVAACVANVGEALEAAKMTAVNVALISPTLKDGPLSGLRALELIYEARPDIRSVILLENDECDITAAFRAGAKGVFSIANGNFKSLCRCVLQVNAGQVWANSSQLHEVLEAFSRKIPRQVVNANGRGLLTNREGEVVRLVEEGMTNK